MRADSSILYFAYGSNLHRRRITTRVPSALPISIGYVEHHRLTFHKRSVDGSGKADATWTCNVDSRVWGAVYRIDAAEKASLDQCEFLGIGYDQKQVDVVAVDGTTTKAWMYIARTCAIDETLRPYSWYLEFVLQGAYQHRLPLCYIKHLYGIESLIDSDSSRQAFNRNLLASGCEIAIGFKKMRPEKNAGEPGPTTR